MRNYSDPKMSITMFDAENVVTKTSGLVDAANDAYFSTATGSDTMKAKAVAVNNILDFTNIQ